MRLICTTCFGLCTFGLLVSGIGGFASADESKTGAEPSTMDELTKALQGDDLRERAVAEQVLKRQRQHLTRWLLRLADSEQTTQAARDMRASAFRLLGEYRVHEGIPLLVENIEFIPPGSIAFSEDRDLGFYPCFAALVRMGPAVIPEIVSYLQRFHPDDVTDNAIRLYAKTLLFIYGPSSSGHEELLALVRRAELRAQAKRRENLQRLLARLHRMTQKGKGDSHQVLGHKKGT